MPGQRSSSGGDWTIESYRQHNEAMRAAEDRLREALRESDKLQEALRASEEKFQVERDRRYKEVADEREKALKIKEEADRSALLLAREIQTYKDEKANELREQINRERGLYVTQNDLKAVAERMEILVKPAVNMALTQQGSKFITGPMILSACLFIITLATLVIAFVRG